MPAYAAISTDTVKSTFIMYILCSFLVEIFDIDTEELATDNLESVKTVKLLFICFVKEKGALTKHIML